MILTTEQMNARRHVPNCKCDLSVKIDNLGTVSQEGKTWDFYKCLLCGKILNIENDRPRNQRNKL